jgi:hypothetical protein
LHYRRPFRDSWPLLPPRAILVRAQLSEKVRSENLLSLHSTPTAYLVTPILYFSTVCMYPGLPNLNLAATTESSFDLDNLDDISDWDTDQLSPSFSLSFSPSARLQIHRSTSLQTEGMSSATISTPKAMPPLHRYTLSTQTRIGADKLVL